MNNINHRLEKLEKSRTSSRIDFPQYLEDFGNKLRLIYGGCKEKIDFQSFGIKTWEEWVESFHRIIHEIYHRGREK